jgi:hypothetical protein
LGEEEEVGDESTLKDDGDVRCIEEFDVVLWWLVSSHVLVFDIDWYLESLVRLRRGKGKKVTWKKITTRKIKTVARIWLILGSPAL